MNRRACAYALCDWTFVPKRSNVLYCCPEHKAAAAADRRRNSPGPRQHNPHPAQRTCASPGCSNVLRPVRGIRYCHECRPEFTPDFLRRHFVITPDYQLRRRSDGKLAGWPDNDGAYQVSITHRGRKFMTKRARVIYTIDRERQPLGSVEHLNGDLLDDRPENLRDNAERTG